MVLSSKTRSTWRRWRRIGSPSTKRNVGCATSTLSLSVLRSCRSTGSMSDGSVAFTASTRLSRSFFSRSYMAWLYARHGTGRKLRGRREGQPEAVIAIADAAKTRLTARFHRLVARGKNRNKVVIAIMRELVGFLWAALRVRSKPARHAVRSSTQIERVEANTAPRSRGRIGAKTISRSGVDRHREARKE